MKYRELLEQNGYNLDDIPKKKVDGKRKVSYWFVGLVLNNREVIDQYHKNGLPKYVLKCLNCGAIDEFYGSSLSFSCTNCRQGQSDEEKAFLKKIVAKSSPSLRHYHFSAEDRKKLMQEVPPEPWRAVPADKTKPMSYNNILFLRPRKLDRRRQVNPKWLDQRRDKNGKVVVPKLCCVWYKCRQRGGLEGDFKDFNKFVEWMAWAGYNERECDRIHRYDKKKPFSPENCYLQETWEDYGL